MRILKEPETREIEPVKAVEALFRERSYAMAIVNDIEGMIGAGGIA